MRQPLFSARLESEPSSAAEPPLSYGRGHSWARAGGNASSSSPPLGSLLRQHPMFLPDCTGGLPPSLSPLLLPRARIHSVGSASTSVFPCYLACSFTPTWLARDCPGSLAWNTLLRICSWSRSVCMSGLGLIPYNNSLPLGRGHPAA